MTLEWWWTRTTTPCGWGLLTPGVLEDPPSKDLPLGRTAVKEMTREIQVLQTRQHEPLSSYLLL